MTSYHLRYQGKVRGPFSLDQLRALHQEGRLPSDVEISEGDGLFYSRDSLRYLFDAPPPAVPRAASMRSGVTGPAPHPGALRPGGGVRRRGNLDTDRGRGGGSEREGRSGSDSKFGVAVGILGLSLVLVSAATVIDRWVLLSIDAASGAAVFRFHFGATSCTGKLETTADPEGELKSRLALLEQKRPYSNASAWNLGLAGPDQSVAVAQLDQTRLLGLAMLTLLFLSAVVGLGAGAAAIKTGSVPGGLGATTMLCGFLGTVCVVCFRFMGVFPDIPVRPEIEIIPDTSFWLGLAAGLLGAVAGGMMAFGGGSRGRGRNIRRR